MERAKGADSPGGAPNTFLPPSASICFGLVWGASPALPGRWKSDGKPELASPRLAEAGSDPETVSTRELLSPAGHALRVHVERIDRVARRHEQPVAVTTAEADIG